MGHGSPPQALLSSSAPHTAPPNADCVLTSRLRTRVPPPHAAEQPLQMPHSPSTQSMGHGAMLHSRLSSMVGHALPLHACGCKMVRVRPCTPVLPHVRLQASQTDHADTRQSLLFSGSAHATHASVLHASLSTMWGHGAPPCNGTCCTCRMCVRMPPPHSTVHALHDAHSATTHSTGQVCMLQLVVSVRAASDGQLPPCCAGARTARVRVC